MSDCVNVARELDDRDACSLMVLFNHADWMTRQDWAKLIQTSYTDLSDDDVVLSDDELSDFDRMIADFLVEGLIVEADGEVTATSRARAVLERHSLGFSLRD